jgi:hypothetical protein
VPGFNVSTRWDVTYRPSIAEAVGPVTIEFRTMFGVAAVLPKTDLYATQKTSKEPGVPEGAVPKTNVVWSADD